ncbi:MAG: 8-oxo-dGTP diphosphatase [Patescibacteria group bacterium]
MKKILTLCFVHDTDGRILLGLKKRGFGAGRWNGFGGKVEAGETIEDATRRELSEETGITAHEIVPRGILHFVYRHTDTTMEVHYFSVYAYEGEPQETEEVKPQWFAPDALPLEQMWPDDKYWMPLYLAGKSFEGEFIFSDYDTIVEHSLREV